MNYRCALQVIRAVIQHATRWWCTANDRQQPTEGSDLYFAEMRAAVVHLTSEIFNNDGLNVVALATVRGSIPIVEELLNTANVYRFRERGAILYDVTYLTPPTTPTTFDKRKSSTSASHAASTSSTQQRRKKSTDESLPGFFKSPFAAGMDVVDEAAFVGIAALQMGSTVASATASAVVGPTTVSCLELIVSMPDEILASRMLDIAPYRQLVRNTWSGYQWIFVILMLIHIVYMTLYTIFALPQTATLIHTYNKTSKCVEFSRTPELHGLFLIWPAIIVVFMIYSTRSEWFRCCLKNCSCVPSHMKRRRFAALHLLGLGLPFKLMYATFNFLPHLSAIAFGAMMITWYALYRCGTTSQAYVQVSSVVFIIGWLFTLNFTKGFEEMHAFSVMLKYIIIRDITRFLFMYVFVLVGFGLAFHALFQVSPTLAQESGSVWYNFFAMFNLMVGLGSPLGNFDDATYRKAGGSPAFVYWIYIFYIAIASVILMNLLVAMMSDTFANIKSNEGVTWKVGSLHLALGIQRSLPILHKLLPCLRRSPVTFDAAAGRWMLSIPSKDIIGESTAKDESIDAMLKVVQRLETKIDRLHAVHGELVKQVDAVSEVVRRNDATAGGVASEAALRRPTVNRLRNAAMMMRARVKSSWERT
jgi:hypothetical protein